MKKYIIGIVSIFFLVILKGNSQPTQVARGTKLFKTPLVYDKPNGTIYSNSASIKGVSNLDWIVFSDRENNITYKDASSSSGKKVSLSYGEKLWVIGETELFLHVVKFDLSQRLKPDKKATLISENAKDYGWIPKANLLLWRQAIVDPVKQFAVKWLSVINDPSFFSNINKYTNSNRSLKLYSSPELRDEDYSGRSITFSRFIFAFKEDATNNSVLLAEKPSLTFSDASEDMLGWVSKSVLEKWGDRVCIEPNNAEKAIEERKVNNMPIKIFKNKIEADNYSKFGQSDEIVSYPFDDPMGQRWPNNRKRLPLFDGTNSAMAVTGFETDLIDKNGKEVAKIEELVAMQEQGEKLMNEYRNVNIIYVVSGNPTMFPYYNAILNSIELSEELGALNTGNNYRFGSVIYRDYNTSGCDQYSVLQLTKDADELKSFLSKQTQTNCDCADKDDALYLGLNQAARMLGGLENQTNVVVVIGGAGNYLDDTKYNADQIVEYFGKARVQLLSFRATSGVPIQFVNFLKQMKDITIRSSEIVSTKAENGTIALTNKKSITPKFEQLPYDLNSYSLLNAPITGYLSLASTGTSLEPERLGLLIDSVLMEINHGVDERINNIRNELYGLEKKMPSLSPAALLAFAELEKFSKDPKLLQKLVAENYQFFVKGYTPISSPKLTNPFYKYVLFLTESELRSLIEQLERFDVKANAANLKEGRQELYNTFLDVLTKFIGAKEATNRIKQEANLEEVMKLVVGLPAQSELLRKTKIQDLKTERAFSNQDFLQMIDYLSLKRKQLENALVSKSYKFDDGGEDLFWIPQEFLP